MLVRRAVAHSSCPESWSDAGSTPRNGNSARTRQSRNWPPPSVAASSWRSQPPPAEPPPVPRMRVDARHAVPIAEPSEPLYRRTSIVLTAVLFITGLVVAAFLAGNRMLSHGKRAEGARSWRAATEPGGRRRRPMPRVLEEWRPVCVKAGTVDGRQHKVRGPRQLL